jgi:putative oxidoreductase
MQASVYLLPFVKVVELLCGLAFVSGFFVPLAAVVIFPITLNILFYSAFLDPKGLPIGVLLLLGNLFLAFYHRKKYAPMLVP